MLQRTDVWLEFAAAARALILLRLLPNEVLTERVLQWPPRFCRATLMPSADSISVGCKALGTRVLIGVKKGKEAKKTQLSLYKTSCHCNIFPGNIHLSSLWQITLVG